MPGTVDITRRRSRSCGSAWGGFRRFAPISGVGVVCLRAFEADRITRPGNPVANLKTAFPAPISACSAWRHHDGENRAGDAIVLGGSPRRPAHASIADGLRSGKLYSGCAGVAEPSGLSRLPGADE